MPRKAETLKLQDGDYEFLRSLNSVVPDTIKFFGFCLLVHQRYFGWLAKRSDKAVGNRSGCSYHKERD